MLNTRRDFLKQGTASIAALGFGRWPEVEQADRPDRKRGPDLALLNGRVYTVDDRRPKAEAFAVKYGRFVALGSTRDIRPMITSSTEVIDAEGMTITPGFIDAHTHPASTGIRELLFVDCNLPTIAEIGSVLRRRAEKAASGEWVYGFKYDDTKLRDARPLTRADLDRAVPNHPVRVVHRGGHTAIYNSLAFKLAQVDKNTPDPQGGKFGREKNGELTGFVAEKARAIVDRPAPPIEVNPRQRQAGVKIISKLMASSGLTSVHDADTGTGDFIAYQDALAAGEMRFRVYAMVNVSLFASLKAAAVRTGFGNDRLRVGGMKFYADGSCSERTMRMSTHYKGRPDDYGILTTTQEELNEIVEDAHVHRFQVGIHANGDVAIDMVLQAYERVLGLHPKPDPRLRIEHCTLVNPDLLNRIAAIGAIPTPFYTYVHYHGNKWLAYGEKRLRWMFAHRSFLDYGIRVAGASDYVPGPYEPLMAIQSMVTRKDFEGRVWGVNQKISIDEALQVCTINGAYASFEENTKGSIVPGKLADFVMLAQDPHDVDPDQIKNIKVVQTFVGGESTYSA